MESFHHLQLLFLFQILCKAIVYTLFQYLLKTSFLFDIEKRFSKSACLLNGIMAAYLFGFCIDKDVRHSNPYERSFRKG